MAGLTQCEEYPGIIKIWDIKFPKENADVCGNFNTTYKNNLCLASESDEQKLKSELGKYCDGKRICNIHLAHGLYGGIHLPCRALNINIRIEIFYDCIYCKFKYCVLHTNRAFDVTLSIIKSSRGTKWMTKFTGRDKICTTVKFETVDVEVPDCIAVGKLKKIIALYLSMPSSLGEHRASTVALHRTLFDAIFLAFSQDRFFVSSYSCVQHLHECLGMSYDRDPGKISSGSVSVTL